MKALREHSKSRTSAKLAKYMQGGSATDCRADGGTVKAKKPAHSALITVEGKAARPRLDRPGRKMRADGGSTISEDSKREIDRIYQDSPRSLGNTKALTMGLGAGAALAKTLPRPVRALGALVGAAGAKGTYDDSKRAWDDIEEMGRIRRGQAEPGKEDRKHGGRVKR